MWAGQGHERDKTHARIVNTTGRTRRKSEGAENAERGRKERGMKRTYAGSMLKYRTVSGRELASGLGVGPSPSWRDRTGRTNSGWAIRPYRFALSAMETPRRFHWAEKTPLCMASGVAQIVLRLLYALTSCKAPLHLALSTREIFDVHILCSQDEACCPQAPYPGRDLSLKWSGVEEFKRKPSLECAPKLRRFVGRVRW